MSIDTVRIGDICEILNGFAFKSENYVESGIRVIRIANVQKGYIEDSTPVFYPEDSTGLDKYMLESGDLLMSLTGNVGRVAILAEEFLPAALNQRVACLRMKSDRVSKGYLYHILNSDYFEQKCIQSSKGVAQKNMSTEWLKDYEIPVYTEEKQAEIVSIFDHLQGIIANRRQELQSLDDIIKARFVEMFEDPVHNTAKLPVLPMTEVCEIIDGDRGKNYPKQEDFFDEEYCLFLNAKNVTNHGFDFSECMFVTKEKDESLRKGKLKRGDIVLTTRGTLGNLAFYTDAVPYENVRINSGMVILRMNKQIIDEEFFIEQFRMQIDDIKKTIASGSAQPQLPISTMNKILVIMPDIKEQKLFSSFVAQVDKSKVAVQKALDEVQLLFDSLMQKYFG